MFASSPCTCFTNGQCRQMNITSVPFGPAASARETVFPVTTSRNAKSGAALPRATIDEGVLLMVVLIPMLAVVVGVLPHFVLRDARVFLANGGHRQRAAGGRIHGKAGNELLE